MKNLTKTIVISAVAIELIIVMTLAALLGNSMANGTTLIDNVARFQCEVVTYATTSNTYSETVKICL